MNVQAQQQSFDPELLYDNCGRPIRVANLTEIPIPRVVPFQVTIPTPAIAGTTRISNTSRYPFVITGLAIATGTLPSFRIKWPDGYYLSLAPLTPIQSGGATIGPLGEASNMFAFNQHVEIPPGGRISIENSGAPGVLSLYFHGFLRCPIESTAVQKALDAERKSGVSSDVSCLVGYPAGSGCLVGYAGAGGSGSGSASSSTSSSAARANRYRCNGNIMAPEFRLGNQCNLGTPAGNEDESFNFFSAPITVTPSTTSTQNIVIVPGPAGSTTFVRQFRLHTTWVPVAGAPDGVPTVALRTPAGRSITDGDQIPALPWCWMPLFPAEGMPAGGRLILDIGTLGSTIANTASMTVTVEFEGYKRLKIQQ